MVARQITGSIQEVSRFYPIVYLGGPRQSGKTTLLRSLFGELPYASLEDPDVREFALRDPRRFLGGYPAGAILDEVQQAPELFSYLQGLVDANKNLRFILSGSQNFLLVEKITQSLAGRAGLLTLLPFNRAELGGFNLEFSLDEFLWKGGFPGLHDKRMPPQLFFSNYVQTYLERDVRSLKNIGDLNAFHKFLKLCAGRSGQLLNLSTLANEADLSVNTVKSWLSVLEASYVIFLLPPWHQNLNKRVTKMHKLYFCDSGLLCYLLGIQSEEQLATHYHYGAIFENAMLVELYKKRTTAGQRPQFYFWQDSNKNEVDLIIEEAGKVKAVEIKSGQTARSDLSKSLVLWNKITGNLPENSFVLYAGALRQERAEGTLLPWQEAVESL